VSGIARSGRVLALMGPSGAGKTTLLNALGNRAPYARVTGEVLFGKRPFVPADLVYVPQFDEVNGILSVYEQIEFVGMMKCMNGQDMRRRLIHLLGVLGLKDKAKTKCSLLTGGELKRVSVGMGMISNPNVLFLDEPTTGLDSSAAFSIATFLVALAKDTEVTVIMTIHQPSAMVFDMLQDLFLLESGRIAYFGPLKATKRYFRSQGFDCPRDTNPADFYLDLIYKPPVANDPEKTWRDYYEASDFHMEVAKYIEDVATSSAEVQSVPEMPSDMHKFKTLLELTLRYYSREPSLYYLRLGLMTLVALFMGTLFLLLKTETKYLNQYAGAIFFNIWTALFASVTASGIFATDRRLAVEHVKNGVFSPYLFCIAQFLASTPFNILCSAVFQCIFHWMTSINPNAEAFFYAILITAGHLLLMEAIMLCVIDVLKNAMLSVTFAMIVMGYLFLFAGFFIKVKDIPTWISWVCFITPTKVFLLSSLRI